VLVVLVAATSFVFAAAPRLFNRVSDDAVRYAVNQAPAVQRNISLALADALPPGPNGGVSQVRAYGDSLAARFPPTLAALVAADPAARIVEQRSGIYLHAEYRSRWLHFVDDLELVADEEAGVVHVRSASRRGWSDLGVNRRRVEALHRAFAEAILPIP